MKKKKYNYGTGYNGVVRNYLETPDFAIKESQINVAKAEEEAMKNGWSQAMGIFGNFLMSNSSSIGSGLSELSKKAMGGTAKGVNIEAEGGEIIETPEGGMAELEGAKHSEGGIALQVPEGTKIFSEQLKGINGLSMADRKKKREKNKMKYEKLSKNNPSDMTLKETLNRIMKANAAEEKEDMMQMEFADMFQNSTKKYAKGGYVNSEGWPPFDFSNLFGMPDLSKMTGTSEDLHREAPMMDFSKEAGSADEYTLKQGTDLSSFTEKNPNKKSLVDGKSKGPWLEKAIGILQKGISNTTAGDTAGVFGNLYSIFANSKNTQANRAGDTPNINAYKDFGNDALQANSEAKEYIKGQRDSALLGLETSKVAATKRGRNSSRGVNQMKAMDIASEMNANKSQRAIYDNFSKQMMGLFTQQAGLENQQDSVVMKGEDMRDTRDREDRDNYFSQMATDIASKGEGIQNIGSILNKKKERKVKGEILNQGFDYIQADMMSGEITQKEGLKLIGDSIADQQSDFNINKGWEKFGLTKTKWDKLSTTEQNQLILKSLNV